VQASLMRRLVSITAIVALMSTLVSPLLAATCEHGTQAVVCHRVHGQKPQKPHCEGMKHEDATDEEMAPSPSSSGPVAQAAPSSQDCPMDCCTVGTRTNAVALSVIPSLPKPIAADRNASIVQVVFSRSGFSSHTDRGPPSA
jgi:hypothetical protein